MLEAYCWPRSVDPGQAVGLHVSTDAAGFEVTVTRDGAEPLEVWRADGHRRSPRHARGRERERLRLAGRAGDPRRRLAQRVLRGDADARATSARRRSSWCGRGAASGRRSCSCSRRAPTTPTTTGADRPCTPVPRRSRCGARWRRGSSRSRSRTAARCSRTPTPRHGGSSSGPSHSVCRCGAAAPDGGTGNAPFAHWAERNGYRVDVAISTDLETEPGLLDGYRSFVCVGHDEYWSWGMREALDAHTRRRRQRGDLQRQHVLLAGPVRPRRRHDDVLQVPLRRGPGARHTRRPAPVRPVVGSADRLARDRARSGSRSPAAATRATGSACRAPRAPSRCSARSIGSSRGPICATATRSAWSTRSSRTRSTDAR